MNFIPLTFFFSFLIILVLILFIIGLILPSYNIYTNKILPYECGFDPINSNRLPFSFRFFLIAILFILFDLEIALLLPIFISTISGNCLIITITLITFILILSLGLIFEWINGGLEWANN